MYRAVDPVLNAAEAVMDRQVSRAEARESFVDARFLELRGYLRASPSTRIKSIWSTAALPTVYEELVAWVHETQLDPEAVLASALAWPIRRDELIEEFAQARADAEADRLADDYLAEAA